MNYQDAGVVDVGRNLAGFFHHIKGTNVGWGLDQLGEPLVSVGHYASVIRIDSSRSLAVTTDGVGTKILVAREMGKWDIIGYDCVAMNVNDLLCVGATPLSMVDYIACDRIDPEIMEQIAIGLRDGAAVSNISISGGEISQVPEIVNGIDLSGTAVGVVENSKRILGWDFTDCVLIGLRSNGIHCNGLTLARKALSSLGKDWFHQSFSYLWSFGQELLTPTRIYVRAVTDLLANGCRVSGIAHITGGGLTNLLRLYNNCSYVIHELPYRMEIFDTIQEIGDISHEEMYRVFNMGIGMILLVKKSDAPAAIGLLQKHGEVCSIIGETVNDGAHRVILKPLDLVCEGSPRSEKVFVKQ